MPAETLPMTILYNSAIILYGLLYLPLALVRGKSLAGIRQRLGRCCAQTACGASGSGTIWLHAVSVGEVNAASPLVQRLLREYPSYRLIVSTITVTGQQVARRLFPQNVQVTYLPVDLSFLVRRVMERVRPSLFIIMETELWPNLITALDRMRVPVVVVNGRISDATTAWYALIRPVFGAVLSRVRLFCVRSDEDAARYIRIGAPPERVIVTGNLKFSTVPAHDDQERSARTIRADRLSLREDARLLVAGSTHPGEETLLMAAYRKLLAQEPGLRLVIAPRHIERFAQIAREARGRGFVPYRLSGTVGAPASGSTPLFILDTLGELSSFYAAADVVFIGGSLVNKGGHNFLEAARFGKPVVCGPHMGNFRDSVALFRRFRALIVLGHNRQLYPTLLTLLCDPTARETLGAAACRIIEENKGVLDHTMSMLRPFLAQGGA